MKILITISLILAANVSMLAQQDDDTVEFVQGLPETGEEAELPPVSPDDVNEQYKVVVPKSEIPPAIAEALKDTSVFSGWDDHGLYFDRKIKLYRVEVTRDNIRRFYTLDEDGNIVSVQEKNIMSDPNK